MGSSFLPEIEPRSAALHADSLLSEPPGKPLCILRSDIVHGGLAKGIFLGGGFNNLRYADDTTLMAESEELKSLLMEVKEQSEKSWLKAQHSEN